MDFLLYVYDAIKQSFIFEWASYRIHSLLKEPAPYRLIVAGMVLSHGLLIAGMMHDAVTRAPSSRYDAVTPAPSSRYDAGSSEQVFCTWLIREWNFAYLHHIHTRESPSEYSEGRYWSTLMYVVLKFLSCLQFQYQTAGIRKLLVRWCGLVALDSSNLLACISLRKLGFWYSSYIRWIFWPKTDISGPKTTFTFGWTPCSGHDREKLFKEKSTLFQNKYQSLKKFWVFFLG